MTIPQVVQNPVSLLTAIVIQNGGSLNVSKHSCDCLSETDEVQVIVNNDDITIVTSKSNSNPSSSMIH